MNAQVVVKEDVDGSLPVFLKILAVLAFIGGIASAAVAVDISGAAAWMQFISGTVGAALLWAMSAIVQSLRRIAHNTRR